VAASLAKGVEVYDLTVVVALTSSLESSEVGRGRDRESKMLSVSRQQRD